MSEEQERSASGCPLCECLERLRSSEAGRHLLQARREMLLAVRAVLDRRIGWLERLLKDEPPAQQIKVE